MLHSGICSGPRLSVVVNDDGHLGAYPCDDFHSDAVPAAGCFDEFADVRVGAFVGGEVNEVGEEHCAVVVGVDHPAVNDSVLLGADSACRWVVGVIPGEGDDELVVVGGVAPQVGLAEESRRSYVGASRESVDMEISGCGDFVDRDRPDRVGCVGVAADATTNR